MRMRTILQAGLLALACLVPAAPARAEQALVAVAANFTDTARALQTRFEQSGEHSLILTSGSTGRLYAQIRHGAPFDVILSADAETPARLEAEGGAVAGTRITYAIGRLALWSAGRPDPAETLETRLRQGHYRNIAIANPALAPYGAAGRATLEATGLREAAQGRLVTGESIAAVQAMLATGNADLGFVPVSQFAGSDLPDAVQYWEVPPNLYPPIRQDAVLTVHGENNAAARAWLDFLASEAAREIIRAHGYEVAP